MKSPEDGPVGPKHVEIRVQYRKRDQNGTDTERMVVGTAV